MKESQDEWRNRSWGNNNLPRAKRRTVMDVIQTPHGEDVSSIEANFRSSMIRSCHIKAEESRSEGDLDRAERSLKLAQNSVEYSAEFKLDKSNYLRQLDLADVLHSWGVLKTTQGAYLDAKKYLLEAIDIYEEVKNVEEDVSFANYSLGELVRLQGRLDDANHYFKTTLEYVESLQESTAQAVIYTSLGALHYERKDYKKAIEHFERAMELYQPTNMENDKLITNTYLQLARYRESMEESLQPLEELMRTTEHTLQKNEWGDRLNLLFADMLLSQDNPENTQEALEIATRTGYSANKLGYLGVEADALALKAIAGKRLGLVGVEELALQSNAFYQNEGVVSDLATRLHMEVL